MVLLAYLPAVLGFTTREAKPLMTRPQATAAASTTSTTTAHNNRVRLQAKIGTDTENFLLEEFKMYNGELLDPYQILSCHRSAERKEIREKYISLSRRYHPDVVMHKDVLPGSCNNLEDVRDQWERIKMAYEILSNKRSRKRYDRHETISDPKAAMQRAAADAAGNAAKGLGKGIFNAGKGLFSFGAKAVSDSMNNNKKDDKVDATKP